MNILIDSLKKFITTAIRRSYVYKRSLETNDPKYTNKSLYRSIVILLIRSEIEIQHGYCHKNITQKL